MLGLEGAINRRKGSSPRSRMDIMANILKAAEEASRKTRIMYSCNLSFRQLKAYLQMLVDEGFLRAIPIAESNPIAEAFQTTEKGQAFLEAYDNLREKLPSSCRC